MRIFPFLKSLTIKHIERVMDADSVTAIQSQQKSLYSPVSCLRQWSCRDIKNKYRTIWYNLSTFSNHWAVSYMFESHWWIYLPRIGLLLFESKYFCIFAFCSILWLTAPYHSTLWPPFSFVGREKRPSVVTVFMSWVLVWRKINKHRIFTSSTYFLIL